MPITLATLAKRDRDVFPPYLYEAYQSTRRALSLPLMQATRHGVPPAGSGHPPSLLCFPLPLRHRAVLD